MKKIKFLLPIMLFSVFISCSLFSNENKTVEVDIESAKAKNRVTTFNGDTLVFKRFSLNSNYPDLPPFTSGVNEGQIIINGYFLTSSASRPPQGIFTRNENNIVITVYWDPGSIVANVPQGYFYSAYINGLTSGTYSVKIVHKNDYLRPPDVEKHTVFQKSILLEMAKN